MSAGPTPWGTADDPVPPGTYEHDGGGRYEVLGMALLADGADEGEPAVVYRPLYPVAGPPVSVRTLAGWSTPRQGRPRFRPVS
ncbi:MAG: DUF1653 domain-containing protein [Actinomycetota bacterium]|nr:DUF1653 domain-containing protein [Actinomycetota bacterium]